MNSIERRFVQLHPRSQKLQIKAQLAFPGGVTHDTRYLAPFPLFMDSATECMKRDVDGLEYIDYVMGHGALLLGHAHPIVTEAAREQLGLGTHLGANTRAEIEWYEAVRRLIPGVEKIRFHSSGTEAVAMAVRLARAYTGRDKIVKFTDHFHGWSDSVTAGLSRYSSSGVPVGIAETALTIPPGNAELLQATVRANNVAAVIIEPTGARMGRYPLGPSFLRDVRQICDENDAVLIFDEIVTGFRVSPGGAQERYGVRPDLTTLGKILAGGLPGAAVGGKADILDMLAFSTEAGWNRNRRVGHPGTFNANPLSAAAGTACLGIIAERTPNADADRAAARLRKGITEALAELDVPGFAYGISSLVWVVLGIRRETALTGDLAGSHGTLRSWGGQLDTSKILKLALLNEGVDIMGGTEFIVSAAHTDEAIDRTVAAVERAVWEIAHCSLLPKESVH